MLLLFWKPEVSAKTEEDSLRVFQCEVACEGRTVSMTFRVHPKHRKQVAVGVGRYGHPAIDTLTAGRIVIPDSVTDPDGNRYRVTGVARQAFGRCSRLTEVVLPEGCAEIGDQAFWGCLGLRELVLPSTLYVIYPFAFRDCRNLCIIRLNARRGVRVYDNIFDQQTLDRATLVVPAGSMSVYSNSLVWGMFHFRIEDYDQK